MEPLNKEWGSIWYQAYWRVDDLTPRSRAWDLAYWHLYRRFDLPFIDKDK